MKKRYGKHDYGLKACVLVVLGTVIFLTIGYAQFTTQLGIYGISATVRVHKDVRIGGIFLSNATNDGISHYEEYNVKDIYGSVTLPNANSSITYDVKVLNLGNVEMGILNISGLPNNLTYSISNYNLEDPLCDDNDSSQCKLGVEKTLHITISYKENGFDENNITYPLDLTFDFKRIYTITYNGFTSTTGLPTVILEDDAKSITFNNTTGIPSNVLVAGATGNYISPTLTITDPTENVTVYKKHLITYVLDGGTQALNQVTTIASNESVTLLNPTKSEYNFGGWYDNSSFEGNPITVLSNVTSDITLYAKWREKTKSQLKYNGERMMEIMKVLSGSGSGYSTHNTTILAFKRAPENIYNAAVSSGATIEKISADDAELETYMWFDSSTGTMYYYSEADELVIGGNSTVRMFARMDNITDISGLKDFDMSGVTDSNRMFQECNSISDLSPLADWDVSNITDMTFMFGHSITDGSVSMAITDLKPLANWNVSSVTTFYQTFKSCRYLTSLEGLENWDVSSATNFHQMFNWNVSLTDATQITGWAVDRTDNLTAMFNHDDALTSNGTDNRPYFDALPGTWNSNGSYTPS